MKSVFCVWFLLDIACSLFFLYGDRHWHPKSKKVTCNLNFTYSYYRLLKKKKKTKMLLDLIIHQLNTTDVLFKVSQFLSLNIWNCYCPTRCDSLNIYFPVPTRKQLLPSYVCTIQSWKSSADCFNINLIWRTIMFLANLKPCLLSWNLLSSWCK